MLRNLRRKLIMIIMSLVGVVLLSVMLGSFASAWNTQHEVINLALEESLSGGVGSLPRMGDILDERADRRVTNIRVLSVDLDGNGVVLATNDMSTLIDAETLRQVVKTAIDSEDDSGWDYSLHIAWMRSQRASGAWRVVIADTSAADVTLRALMLQNVGIVLVAMAALFGISLWLSSLALRPVEQAWNQQRQFIADASHELKTPLAVIIANTQILQKDGSIPQESRRWIESTADESAHMKSLVEELLELARTDESASGNASVMHKEELDFSSMVENAALEFDAIAFERGSEIVQNVAQGVRVMGDPEWVERLCKILIENACKYSFVGQPIHVELKQSGRQCVLSVNNHGNVIDPEDLPHVFDRFYRTDKARSRDAKTGGFGLGLAIAKGICIAHGGDITAASDETLGTTFTATLPTVP